jgi:rhomboid protease GluP
MEINRTKRTRTASETGVGTALDHSPIATLLIIFVTTLLTGSQILFPALLPALDRNFGAVQAGQLWRLVTPRFVQPDIWPQFVLLAIVAAVGMPVERRYGSLTWIVAWLAGGIAGEVVSYSWQPQGAGASLGLCGVIGAWSFMMLRREEVPWRVAPVALAFIAYLTGVAAGAVLVGEVGSAIVAGSLIQLRRLRPGLEQWNGLSRPLGVACLCGGLVLTALRDQHGPPLLAGAVITAVMAEILVVLREP